MAAHLVKGLPSFMLCFLRCSQQTPSGSYLEPDEFNPHHQSQFLITRFNFIPLRVYIYIYIYIYICTTALFILFISLLIFVTCFYDGSIGSNLMQAQSQLTQLGGPYKLRQSHIKPITKQSNYWTYMAQHYYVHRANSFYICHTLKDFFTADPFVFLHVILYVNIPSECDITSYATEKVLN